MYEKLNPIFPRLALPGLLAISLLVLSACGGGGGGGGNPGPTPTNTYARFAYAANFGDDSVSVYIADNDSGRLRHHGYALTGDGPRQLVIHPSGEFAYSVNYNAKTLSLFTVDSLAGELTAAACDGIAGNCASGSGGTPTALVFGSSGRYAYVANEVTNRISIFSVDLASGALSYLSDIASGGSSPVSLRLHPNGQFLYLTHQGSNDIGIYAINPSDGTLAAISGSPVSSGGSGAMDIAITSDGLHAYVANQTSGDLGVFNINAAGLLVPNGSAIASGGSARSLAVDQTDAWLYAANADASGTVSLFAIQGDGSLTKVNCSGTVVDCPVGGTPEAITLDPTNQFVSVANRDDDSLSLFMLDPNNGELSRVETLTARDAPGSITYLADTAPVTITPRFAYVANETSNDLSAFRITAASGALSAVGTPVSSGGTAPSSVSVDPTGRFVYVTNSGSHSVSAYAINAGTGALSAIGTPVDTVQIATWDATVDPSGRFLYAVNLSSDSISVFAIDGGSGTLTKVGSPVAGGDGPNGVTVDPSGRFLYVANTNSNNLSAYAINAGDGTLTEIAGSPVTAGNGPLTPRVDPTGRFLYVANTGLSNGKYWVSGYAIDANSGALSELAGSPYDTINGSGPTALAVDPLGEYLYVTNLTTDNVKRFAINSASGELTTNNTYYATGVDPQSIAIDASGRYVYTANGGSHDVSAYTISASDGSLNELASSPIVTGGSGPLSIATSASVQ